MPYLTPKHLTVALEYLSDKAHPQLITLLAMFRAKVPVSDSDEDAVWFGAREENLLLSKYFQPEGAPDDRSFYVPFGQGSPSRWRDHRYAGRSLQRMRKDRHNTGLVFRQSSIDNKLWSIRSSFVDDLRKQGGDTVGQIPLSLVMLGIWLFRTTQYSGDLSDLVKMLEEDFNFNEYFGHIPDDIFDLSIPSVFDGLEPQNEPISPENILSLLDPIKLETIADSSCNEPEITDQASEEPPGRWNIARSELEDLGGLAGLERPALQALAALQAGMHVIFTGPPGSGKTTLAVNICRQAGFPYWTVSATDQWTTFDTIGGYFPTVEKGQLGEQLDFVPGHIVDTIERQRCLIIDEINRADIDKAFGEMFTLLSGQAVTLPFRRKVSDGSYRRVRLSHSVTLREDDLEVIEIPRWWRIIGAMNDADKQSLKQLSYAFMRRFAFVAVSLPSKQTYRELLDGTKASEPGIPETVHQTIVELFSDEGSGFGRIGIPFGPAIPLSMLRHASKRMGFDQHLGDEALLSELLEAYVAPQLQGRADLHEPTLELLRPTLGAELSRFEKCLTVWTGFVRSSHSSY